MNKLFSDNHFNKKKWSCGCLGIEARQAVISLSDGQNRVYVLHGGVGFQAQETQNIRQVYKLPVTWLHLTLIAIF